jgi:hypothetical protein
MNTKLLTTLFIATGLTLASVPASANDDLAAALVLGGTGAVLGNAIGGSEGAAVGGFLGLLLGAASADNNDRYAGYRNDRYYRRPPPPAYVVAPYPGRPYWREEWREHRDGRWYGDGWRDNWHDGRGRGDGDRWGHHGR